MAMIESVYLLNTETEKASKNENIAPIQVQNSDNPHETTKEDLIDKIVCIIHEVAPAEKIFLISSTTDQPKRPKLDFIVLTESTEYQVYKQIWSWYQELDNSDGSCWN